MAREIIFMHPSGTTGLSVFAHVFGADGELFAQELELDDDESLGIYSVNFPALAAGVYYLRIYDDDTSAIYKQTVFYWDGDNEVNLLTIDAALKVINQGTQDASILVPHTTDIA